jgi:hypothetical protein
VGKWAGELTGFAREKNRKKPKRKIEKERKKWVGYHGLTA